MPNINISTIDQLNNVDNPEYVGTDTSFIDCTFQELENYHEINRKCLQMVDSTVLNNKRLVDENFKLRRHIHLLQKKIYSLNDMLHDFSYQKEINKLYMFPFLSQYLRLNEKDKKEKCPICLDLLLSLTNEDIVKTSCGHYFHGTCYYKSRNASEQPDSCVYCRQRHLPFDIGYVNNLKNFINYTDTQTRDRLSHITDTGNDTSLPTSDEILCQIQRQVTASNYGGLRYY